MSNCLFCNIAAGSIPAAKIHEDETVVAFRDINPQAPTHILIIPRAHIPHPGALTPEQAALMGQVIRVAGELARQEGLAEGGYRLVINSGPDAGQTVDHLHVHLLGGRPMTWPPG